MPGCPLMKYPLLTLFFLLVSGAVVPAHSADVNLAWDAVSGAAGYRLYYEEQGSGNMQNVDIGDATSVDFTGLADMTGYACFVTAYDALGTESPFSNELDFTTSGSVTAPVTPVVTVNPAINVSLVNGNEQGTATFLLSASAAQPITVAFILFGTGNLGSDYTSIYSQMTFPAGSTSVDVDDRSGQQGDSHLVGDKRHRELSVLGLARVELTKMERDGPLVEVAAIRTGAARDGELERVGRHGARR